MVAFVDFVKAKKHLRIDHDDEDQGIQYKIELASSIIADYIGRPELDWIANSETVEAPFVVQAAVLLQLSLMWENRSGGDLNLTQADGYLSKPITALLHRWARLTYS